jgi:hypothetical protein
MNPDTNRPKFPRKEKLTRGLQKKVILSKKESFPANKLFKFFIKPWVGSRLGFNKT